MTANVTAAAAKLTTKELSTLYYSLTPTLYASLDLALAASRENFGPDPDAGAVFAAWVWLTETTLHRVNVSPDGRYVDLGGLTFPAYTDSPDSPDSAVADTDSPAVPMPTERTEPLTLRHGDIITLGGTAHFEVTQFSDLDGGMAMVWPVAGDDERKGWWAGLANAVLVARHDDSHPHEFGRLAGCPACEAIGCVCNSAGPDGEPCVSTACERRTSGAHVL